MWQIWGPRLAAQGALWRQGRESRSPLFVKDPFNTSEFIHIYMNEESIITRPLEALEGQTRSWGVALLPKMVINEKWENEKS